MRPLALVLLRLLGLFLLCQAIFFLAAHSGCLLAEDRFALDLDQLIVSGVPSDLLVALVGLVFLCSGRRLVRLLRIPDMQGPAAPSRRDLAEEAGRILRDESRRNFMSMRSLPLLLAPVKALIPGYQLLRAGCVAAWLDRGRKQFNPWEAPRPS